MLQLPELVLVDDDRIYHESLEDWLEINELGLIIIHAFSLEEGLLLPITFVEKNIVPAAIIIDGDLRSGSSEHDGETIARNLKQSKIKSCLIGRSAGNPFDYVDHFVDKNGDSSIFKTLLTNLQKK